MTARKNAQAQKIGKPGQQSLGAIAKESDNKFHPDMAVAPCQSDGTENTHHDQSATREKTPLTTAGKRPTPCGAKSMS